MKAELNINVPVINDAQAYSPIPYKADKGYASVGTSDTDVYEVSSPISTFYLKKIVITNTSGNAATITIKEGTSTVMSIYVGDGTTREIDFEGDGIPFTSNLKAVSSAGTIDVTVYGNVTYILE